VDDQPIIYWQDKQDDIVPYDASQVFLVNSKSIDVYGLNLYNIHIFYSTEIEIYNNSISGDFDAIISLYHTNNSQIIQNSITTMYVAILLTECENIEISNNYAEPALSGIYFPSVNYGILLLNTYDSQVRNNVLHDFHRGITLTNSFANEISGNVIENSFANGIILNSSQLNEVLQNVVFNSVWYALILADSSFNTISWNDFINSRSRCGEEFCSQAEVNLSGNDIQFNYWSDWTSPDKNFDCIVDNKYPLEPFDEDLMMFDSKPISRPIAYSNVMDNKFCSQRAEFSAFIQENKTEIYIGSSILLIMLVAVTIRKIIRKRRKAKSIETDLYPDEEINNI
jgi:parallel beta-helix repeat protein